MQIVCNTGYLILLHVAVGNLGYTVYNAQLLLKNRCFVVRDVVVFGWLAVAFGLNRLHCYNLFSL